MSAAHPEPSRDVDQEPGKEAPQRQRRRPRKLNRDGANALSAPAAATGPASGAPEPPVDQKKAGKAPSSNAELEALKSRVRGLEAKVEELYKAGATAKGPGSNRSPRRRGKGKKGASRQSSAARGEGAGGPEVAENLDEEEGDIERLEADLAVARRHLASYGAEDEDVEEIARDAPGVQAKSADRKVTLTGNYRIPLPTSVNVDDVRSIQSGIASAGNVARSFLEQRRSQHTVSKDEPAARAGQGGAGARSRSIVAAPPDRALDGSGDKRSWGEWFGGYSMAISRAMQHIEAEAAVEAEPTAAPRAKARTSARGSAAPAKAAAAASSPSARAPAARTAVDRSGAQRPPLNARSGNGARMSAEQVETLMS